MDKAAEFVALNTEKPAIQEISNSLFLFILFLFAEGGWGAFEFPSLGLEESLRTKCYILSHAGRAQGRGDLKIRKKIVQNCQELTDLSCCLL